MVKIGPFELVRELGSGATGSVWVARHQQRQLEVALKMVHAERVQSDRNWVLFRNEMRALARLSHPGIVTLFDVGEVSSEEADAAAGQLVANTLYIVMELVGDTLVDATDTITDFDALQHCLLQLLDALAHAHARGVIHRDIKPANVLTSANAQPPVFKLVDFGVARALQDPYAAQNERLANCGTPSYMAPEQINGQMRDQGAWTDLYSLGCLVHYLCTGQPPFTGTLAAVIASHLRTEPPTLEARFPVPDGFEALLRKMLRKPINERYQRAADIARDLLALRRQPGKLAVPAQRVRLASFGGDDGNKPTPGLRLMSRPANSFALDLQPAVTHANGSADRSPWRRSGSAAMPPRLLGVGTSLYHLRPVPWVNRDAERDLLWQALREVADSKQPKAIVVRGDAGVGKSRLAEWLTERAHELGEATPLCATHAPIDGQADGIPATVARFLRLEGLEKDVAFERLAAMARKAAKEPVADADIHLLVDILCSGQPAAAASRAHAKDRRAAVMRLVETVAHERPVVLWIGDAHWAAPEVHFCSYLLEHARCPVLMLLTVREENLDDHLAARPAIDALLTRERASELWLKPLSEQHQHELVARLLQLDGELTAWVAKRTEGNPLFAVQLIGDWVERRVLDVGENGLRLASAEPALPESVHALWRMRLDHLWTRLGANGMAALEVAALLGHQVQESEWRNVCAVAAVEIPDDLIPAMVAMRLARLLQPSFPDAAQQNAEARAPATGMVWSFAHGMLRESIARISTDNNRSTGLHHACALTLRRRRAPAQRVAEHLLCAHAWSEALGPLLEAAEFAAQRGDFDRALGLDDRRDDALERAGYAANAPERIRGWLRRARTLCLRGEVDHARSLLERAKLQLGETNDLSIKADLAWAATGVARATNDYDTGIAMARQAVRGYQQLDDTAGAARGEKRLGELFRITGAVRSSIRHYLNAQRGFEHVGDAFELAWTLMGLSASHRQLGEYALAEEHARKGLDAFTHLGSRVGIGHAHNELGEAARVTGHYATAETHYQQALAAWQADQHRDCSIVEVNLAFAALGAENIQSATKVLRGILATAREKSRSALQVYALVGLCACAAAECRWTDVENYADEAATLIAKIDMVDLDIAQCITRAAEHAHRAARLPLCQRLAALAIPQWQTLGHDESAANLRALAAG